MARARHHPLVRSLCAVVIAVPFVWLLASGFGRDPNAISSPLIDRRAPSFTLRSIDGREVSLASFRGRPVIVNFWASWCTACKFEHPYLLAAWRAYREQGVAFVGVLFSDNAGNARAFIQRYGGGWPDVLDPAQRTAINYGVYGVPETFFIDRAGIVRYKSTGPVTPLLLYTDIQHLLRGSR